MKRSLALVAALALAGSILALGSAHADDPALFKVGAAKKLINPTAAQGYPDGKGVYLGGSGLGAANRRGSDGGKSTGIEMDIYVRAMVIQNAAGDTLAFAINETQGSFAKYQQGPWGLDDMRIEINERTGIPVKHIVLGSDHSHRGPDTTFVWGGVNDAYLQYIHDQTVDAVVTAFTTMQDATIWTGQKDNAVGCGDTRALSADNLITDKSVHVLQARAISDDKPIVTFMEVPCHSTSYGLSSSLIHPDWEGAIARRAEAEFGGMGIGWQGDIGRQGGLGDAQSYPHIQDALATAKPITDDTIKGTVAFMVEPVTNPLYIYFLSGARATAPVTCIPQMQLGGNSLCTPVARANTPPYGAGALGGFHVTNFRIGDVSFSGGPGEVYPNIRQGVVDRVAASNHFYLGLAQDQIGYIMSPTQDYAQIIASNPQSDNWLFNGGPSIGDHLMCTHLKLAAQLGFSVAPAPPICSVVSQSDPVAEVIDPVK